ncbi:MAG: TrkA family potassium uptake protein [Bacteroidales bacterium]
MNYLIIGLGNFGAALARKLTETGHEVIAVDSDFRKVDAIKEEVTHSICLDCTDPHAVTTLPLKDTDIAIICIGENEGANILTTALMKQMKVKKLIGRAVSPLHMTILEAMGIDEIIQPEEESALRWAEKLNLKGMIDYFDLGSNHLIIEAEVPERFTGKSLAELQLGAKYNILVLTTIRRVSRVNLIGAKVQRREVQSVATASTVLEAGDIMVLYGTRKDISKLMNE